MVSSNTPARVPERQPEINAAQRTTWPRPASRPARFPIRIVGNIPV
jgi:hypothetical protein